MTRLEVVNYCLLCISERPVNSLTNLSVSDASMALQLLEETNKGDQIVGWTFNTNLFFTLTPDVEGYIYLPSNTLNVDCTNYAYNVSQRGNRLYDNDNNTFIFNQPIEVDLVLLLDFEETPNGFANFIKQKTARSFQARVVGSLETDKLLQSDLERSYLAWVESESQNQDANIFQSPDMYNYIRR